MVRLHLEPSRVEIVKLNDEGRVCGRLLVWLADKSEATSPEFLERVRHSGVGLRGAERSGVAR
eukprot:7166718-Alexandrium_andersonii.AAC.1